LLCTDGWRERWVESTYKGSEQGAWGWTAGKFYGDAEKDKGNVNLLNYVTYFDLKYYYVEYIMYCFVDLFVCHTMVYESLLEYFCSKKIKSVCHGQRIP